MGLTETAVRKELERRGIDIAFPQLRRLERKGLIPEREAGLYPCDLPDRIERIHELGERQGYKPLERRLVYLRGQHGFWYVDPEKLRAAMVAVAGAMDAPYKKARIVLGAYDRWLRSANSSDGVRAGLRIGIGWRLPPDWKAPTSRTEVRKALLSAEIGLFAEFVGRQYNTAWMLAPLASDWGYPLEAVPFEEQVVILTAAEMSAQAAMRQAARAAEQERQVKVDETKRRARETTIQ